VSAGTLYSSGLIAGGSLAGILYAALVGTGTIDPFQAIGNALPFLHQGASGLVAGSLLFFLLAVVLSRAGQKKIA
jgi:putative copper export protein